MSNAEPDVVDDRIRRAMGNLAEQIAVKPPRFEEGPRPAAATGRHRYLPVAVVSFAAAVVALLLFLSNEGAEDSMPTLDQEEAGCQADQEGKIYLVAGESNTSAALYQGTLCPLLFRAVPGVTRVRGVSGAGDLLAVTHEGGGIEVGMEGVDSLAPLPGVTDQPHAGDAAVSPEGLIAFTTSQPISGGVASDRLHVFDPETGETKPILADNRFLSRPRWGPGGRIATFRRAQSQGEVPEITIVEPDGRARHFPLVPPPLLGEVWTLEWGASNLVAVSYDILDPNVVTETVLIDPDNGTKQVLRGWRALAWSPDGTRLLMQGEDGLALARAPRFNRPRKLGPPPSSVFAAAWLSCTTTTCAPPAAASDPQKRQVDFADFERLAQEGRLVNADFYPGRSEVKGLYLDDEGRQVPYRVRAPSSVTKDDLVQELLGNGVPVTVHDSLRPDLADSSLRTIALVVLLLVLVLMLVAAVILFLHRSRRA